MSKIPDELRCYICEELLDSHISCNREVMWHHGRSYKLIPVKKKDCEKGKKTCKVCGAPIGGIHHAGCCNEECPVCGGKLFDCNCQDDYENDATFLSKYLHTCLGANYPKSNNIKLTPFE